MAEKAPNPTHDPYDVWVVRTTWAAIKRSRELLDETKALVEPPGSTSRCKAPGGNHPRGDERGG